MDEQERLTSEFISLRQLDNETPLAYVAFLDYVEIGDARSLSKLHQKYTEDTPDNAPTRHLRTLKKWSSEHNWQGRIRNWLNERAVTYQERQVERQIAVQEKQWQAYLERDRAWWHNWQKYGANPSMPQAELRTWGIVRDEIDAAGKSATGLPETLLRMQHEDWRSRAIEYIRAGEIDYNILVEEFDEDLATQLFKQAGVPIPSE